MKELKHIKEFPELFEHFKGECEPEEIDDIIDVFESMGKQDLYGYVIEDLLSKREVLEALMDAFEQAIDGKPKAQA